MNSKLKISLLACFSFLFALTSCTDEDINLSDFADETLFLVESDTRSGRLGCYELVYPVTIAFPDGTSQEVDSPEAFRDAVKTWKENNQDLNGRPHLAFPYDVVTEDGEVITVDTREERFELAKACRAEMGHGPHGHLGKPCFRIVYPISIVFPDGTSTEVGSRKDLKMTVRAWRKDNPGVEGRTMINFPITVVFEDGTTQVVNSKEELKQLKKDCRD